MDIPPGAPGGGPVLAPLALIDEEDEINRPSWFWFRGSTRANIFIQDNYLRTIPYERSEEEPSARSPRREQQITQVWYKVL